MFTHMHLLYISLKITDEEIIASDVGIESVFKIFSMFRQRKHYTIPTVL